MKGQLCILLYPSNNCSYYFSITIKNLGFGIHIKEDVHPKELQKLLDKIEGSDAENLISKVTLRSMQKAMYGTTCIGHFGLAAKYYCHFTSPIRRYPDLQIHRIIKEHIHKEFDDKRRKHYIDLLPDVCKNSSALERRADEAEREVEKYEKVMFMKDKIGQIYEGTISGVTKWGLFVELSNTVEGLVRITYLTDDTYELDEKHYELYGRSRGKRYKLGQKLKVWVYDIDSVMKTIDFKLANDYEE